MWVWVGIGIFAVLVWVFVGQVTSPSGSTGASNQNCELCKNDQAYYNSLHGFKKFMASGWWAFRSFNCRNAGCI
jgi:hypothetical protein